MNPLCNPPFNTAPADEDHDEQAVPGLGISSKVPDPAEHTLLNAKDAQCEV